MAGLVGASRFARGLLDDRLWGTVELVPWADDVCAPADALVGYLPIDHGPSRTFSEPSQQRCPYCIEP